MQYYIQVLKDYTKFDGRATRSEFWYFMLFHIIVFIVLGFVDSMLGVENVSMGYGLFTGLYWLGTLSPSIGVGIRRLHDIGKPGWWLLLGFIPLIGAIILIVFYIMDSESGSNEYGPNPKGEAAQTHDQSPAIEKQPPKEPPVTRKEKPSRPKPPPVPGEGKDTSSDE